MRVLEATRELRQTAVAAWPNPDDVLGWMEPITGAAAAYRLVRLGHRGKQRPPRGDVSPLLRAEGV
jgi:hypothetical protein